MIRTWHMKTALRHKRLRPLRLPLLAVLAWAGFAGAALADGCKVAEPEFFLDAQGQTAPPTNGLPAPPTNNDCGFYNWAWRTFMYSTANTASSEPAFMHYDTVEDVFPTAFQDAARTATNQALPDRISLKVARGRKGAKHSDLVHVLNDGLRQASFNGEGPVLVDQNGNPIFYSINVNDDYTKFIRDNHIDDIPRLLKQPHKDQDNGAIPAELEFRTGSLELKSAWMIVEGPLSGYSNYIVARARVPMFRNLKDPATHANHIEIDPSKPLRDVNVALLGLHVVGVIDGHPEFVWATFEHAGADGRRDLAPEATDNPDPDSSAQQSIVRTNPSYPLFYPGTGAEQANDATEQDIGPDQKFATPTSVYRMFPGSQATKPSDGEAASPWEDPEVYSLNTNVGAVFDRRDPRKLDRRRNYRLVGAVWIDQPRAVAPAADALGTTPVVKDDGTEDIIGPDGKVKGGIGATIAHNFDAGLVFDEQDARLAGENRLSNMAMEPFMQSRELAPHCFSCHNTAEQDTGAAGSPLWPRRINMSHLVVKAVRSYLQRLDASAEASAQRSPAARDARAGSDALARRSEATGLSASR